MNPLEKEITKARKQALADCWMYHKTLIHDSQGEGHPMIKKSELLDFLYDLSLEDWEDVGYFVGYLRALDNVKAYNRGERKSLTDPL